MVTLTEHDYTYGCNRWNAMKVKPTVTSTATSALACQLDAKRNYRHWWRVLPEDFELNTESMPKDCRVAELLALHFTMYATTLQDTIAYPSFAS
eukprot:6479942-Amphidinium_carterae.1